MTDIKDSLLEIGKKIDEIIASKYVDPMIEVRRLCDEHRKEMGCDVLVYRGER